MGIFDKILTNNVWSKRLLKRGLDIPAAQTTGKVMASSSSPESTNYPALMWYNYNSGYQALQLSAVYAALSIISNSIATLPIYVKQQKDNEKTIVKNSKIQKLFYSMLQSKHTVIKQIVWDLLLWGNAFLYIKRIDGKPEKLIYMQHGDVQIDYKKEQELVQYQCSNHKDVPALVPQEDMLHFAKDTFDGIQGRGFTVFAKDIIDLSGFTQKAASEFFGSGCNLTGILKYNRPLKPGQQEQIRQQWQQVHSATGGGLAVLEGDADYIPVAQSANDSQMLETREFNISEIARFFNINPVLLGDLSHSSYNDIEQAQLEFIQHTLLPIINLLEEEIDRKLITVSTQYIDFDETELLRGNKTTMSDYYNKLVTGGIITVDEARVGLGYNEFNDGYSNKLIIPYTDISQNVINNGDINTDTEE